MNEFEIKDKLDEITTAKESAKRGIITQLAELPQDSVINETALAEIFGVDKRTIRRMVGRFEIPPPEKIAGQSRWLSGMILRYFKAKLERKSKEAERKAMQLERIK